MLLRGANSAATWVREFDYQSLISAAALNPRGHLQARGAGRRHRGSRRRPHCREAACRLQRASPLQRRAILLVSMTLWLHQPPPRGAILPAVLLRAGCQHVGCTGRKAQCTAVIAPTSSRSQRLGCGSNSKRGSRLALRREGTENRKHTTPETLHPQQLSAPWQGTPWGRRRGRPSATPPQSAADPAAATSTEYQVYRGI
jgi:hypothetical protein